MRNLRRHIPCLQQTADRKFLSPGDCQPSYGSSYDCTCAAGYSGTNCDTDACSPNPCSHGGSCSHESTRQLYSCSCVSGYSGEQCLSDTFCEPNPCHHQGATQCRRSANKEPHGEPICCPSAVAAPAMMDDRAALSQVSALTSQTTPAHSVTAGAALCTTSAPRDSHAKHPALRCSVVMVPA